MNATPDQHRRIVASQLDGNSEDIESLFRELTPGLLGVSDSDAVKVFARPDKDEIIRLFRAGHLSEEHYDLGYIARLNEAELNECRAILRFRRRAPKINYAALFILETPTLERLVLPASAILFSSFRYIVAHIGQLPQIAFQIDADKRECRPPSWRLNGHCEKEIELIALIKDHSSALIRNRVLFLQQLRAANEA
jgi:hypothetical protein